MLFFTDHKEHGGFHRERYVLIVHLCFLILLYFTPQSLFAQISYGGRPASFNELQTEKIPEISLPAPESGAIRDEDIRNENMGFPRRVGISINAGIDVIRDGKLDVLPNGTKVWRIIITSKAALALGLYYDDFYLPGNCRMFVYDDAHQQVLGAYTLFNNRKNRLFSTGLISGDRLTVEIDADPGVSGLLSCNISDISYVYRDMPDFLRNRGTADDCEVNINCPEGANWQFQKRGVARIYVRYNNGFFWCSGSLLNNTLQNNEPFFLTADHCGPSVTPDELSQWIFYFNYESPACANPTEDPASNSMNGAEKLANANTNGSDFLLLRLADTIPVNYEPYYNGWSIENIISTEGVTIHHPAGDIKKISTYTVPIQSSTWNGIPGTHWEVYWSETADGWGVTEGGSSGSPLFDNTGKIIGALTGGQSSCDTNGGGFGTGPDKPDYYGKFSYSWDQNGSEPAQQLKYWLDPINSGVTTLTGKYTNLTAAFQASVTLLLKGNSVVFTNLSSGLPDSWEWTFEGGVPATYSGPEPGTVKYPEAGQFDVRLIVSNGTDYDTLWLKDYIEVVGKVYPNPTSGKVNIFLEEDLPAYVKIDVFNMIGQMIYQTEVPDQSFPLVSVDLSTLSAGIYTIRIEVNQRYVFARVIVSGR